MLCNYLADDDPCKAVDGNCQPVDTHCGGVFRVGLCPGLPTRCCVPQGKSICRYYSFPSLSDIFV